MKARSLLIVLLLLLTTLSAIAQPIPIPILGTVPPFPKPSSYSIAELMLGWYNNTQVWFACAATNNISYTRGMFAGNDNGQLVLSPKLSSALTPKVPGGPTAAQPVYVVTNFQNPPVFTAIPGQPLYSALWQVFTVTWLPGVTPRGICNANPASPTNPTGLPGPAEATITATNVVVDCPIFVVGRFVKPFPTTGGGYITPQAAIVDTYFKEIALPIWFVSCTNPINKHCDTAIAFITDVADPALAATLGANLAPGLLNMPDSDTSDFFVQRGPKPLTQLPIVSACAMGFGMPSFPTTTPPADFGYSPVMQYVILQRNLPPTATVCSIDTLNKFLDNGCLTVLSDSQRINALVFDIEDL